RSVMRFNALAVLVLGPAVVAQGTMQLTLKRAVEIALAPEGSERVALARETVAQAESKTLQARNAFLPVFDGSVQERLQTVNLRTFGLSFDFPVPGFSLPGVVGPFGVLDARASGNVPVVDFGII